MICTLRYYNGVYINIYLLTDLKRYNPESPVFTFISENTGKFLLRALDALTNSIYCNSERGALMNRFTVMMTPIGWEEFPTIF